MASSPEYIRKVFDVRYKLKIDVITRPKDKNNTLAKNQAEIVLDRKTLK